MVETRAKGKETVMKESDEVFETRCAAIEELVTDQNKKMEKSIAEVFEAIRLLAASNSSSGEANRGVGNSPNVIATQDPRYPPPDRDKTVKSGTVHAYDGLNRLGKVDFPRFDGDKLKEWLFKVEEFFEIARTPDGLKIGLASAHFDGLAAIWHQLFAQSKLGRNDIHDWNTYKMLLEGQFEEVLEDPIAELKQLRETNGIAEYHAEFELLRTRVDLTEDELVISFLDGLQPETQLNVKMFQPQTVSQCLLIGRLYEQAHPKKPFTSTGTFAKSYNSTATSKRLLPQPKDGEVKTNQQLSKVYNKPASPTAREFLSQEERSDKRAKGLCFSCDEKFTLEHDWQHKKTQLYTKEVDAETKEVEDEIEPETAYGDDNELVNIEVTTSTDLLLSKETNSPPHIAMGCELEAGVIDMSINQNQLIQEEAKNHSTDSFQGTSLLHHKNSILKHQVSISHWEFCHRSPIECLDVYKEFLSANIASQVFDPLPLRMKLLRNRRMTTFSKNWCFKFKELDVRQEDIQNVLLASMLMIAIEARYATTFKDVRLMSQTHMSRRWCEVWQIHTLQDLQQFTLGEVRFQIKHKWRFKLLHLVSELNFSLGSVACLSLSDDQCDHCVVVRTCCVWTTHMLFGSKGNHVWHRWKARCFFFVGVISTMWAWLFGEEGFDIGKEMTRGGSGLKEGSMARINCSSRL